MNNRSTNSIIKAGKTARVNLILAGKHLLGRLQVLVSAILAAGLMVVLVAGCSNKETVNNEATTSAIRAAEEVGASNVPSASLYLQLAKEELENAKGLATSGEKEKAESMLLRAQADGELAVALSRGDADKTAAREAIERVRQLRQNNQLPQDRK